MSELNFLAILVATVLVFIVSGAWYSSFGSQLARLNDAYAGGERPGVGVVLAELMRSFVVATVLAGLMAQLGIEDWGSAVALGLIVWVGFPLVILSGSVLHEKVPWKLAAIHVGDWLVKLVLISAVVGLWQ